MSAEMTMRCEDVAPYLSAFADGELPEPLRSEVAEHIATCVACSATLARYAEIDTLFAVLPRSAPPPEAFDQILAAIADEEEQEEHHRALRATWGVDAIKHRIAEFDIAHIGQRVPPHRGPKRSRWVSAALPAIAALLLISVTLVTFHWLPGRNTGLPSILPSPTPASGNDTLITTRNTVRAIEAQLAFKPVLPTYLPDGALLYNVSIWPARDTEVGAHVLDITWSVSDPVHLIHLRESTASNGLPEYVSLASSTSLKWQIGNAPWLQARYSSQPNNLAMMQHRAGVDIGLDIPMKANGPQGAVGQSLLRLLSLSMDSPYLRMPVAPGENSAQIVPLAIDSMVAHYSAVALNGNGGVAWREESYVAPCTSTAQLCQVRTALSWGVNGGLLSTDIASGQRLLHLDDAQKTYSWLPLLPAEQHDALKNSALPKLFYLANTYLSSGILWYVGQTSYKGEKVYDLLWTNAPTRTHVYVSVATHSVVAMATDSHARILSGGPIAGVGSLSCLRYISIEYLPTSPTTDTLFAQTIPTGYQPSLESRLDLSC
jgi:hypothetical protein